MTVARRRGIALITTLLMTMVLIIMVTTTVVVVRNEANVSRNYSDQVAVLYIAEAAIADAMSRIEIDPNWVDGFISEPMPSRRGNYSVYFNTAGNNFQPHHSVNNISGASAANGPRGRRTVPAHTASIVVVARSGSVERQVEVTLTSKGVLDVEYPLLTSRRIELQGDVNVNGLQALESEQRVAAGIHSNYRGKGGTPTIRWDQDRFSDRATITGKVSTRDSRSGAIDFGSTPSFYEVTGGFEKDAARRDFPRVGSITQKIEARRLRPDPNLEDGTNVLKPGEFYKGGNVEVQGDLVLNDTDLFIEGDLTVNGAITGEGSVYVKGKTFFKGDSSLSTTNKTAIMSRGSVEMVGFDGGAYMKSLGARNPEVQVLWAETQRTVAQIQSEIETARGDGTLPSIMGEGRRLDQLRAGLGRPGPSYTADVANRPTDRLGQLVGHLKAEEPSSGRNFMLDKLSEYRNFFSSTDAMEDGPVAKKFAAAPGTIQGAFDAVVDARAAEFMPAMLNQISGIGYGKLGSSYFQGVVYSNGYVYASNDVTVLGALLVDGKAGDPVEHSSGKTLSPGDLYLMNGTNVTFIRDFFAGGKGSIKVPGLIHMRSWAAR